MAQTEAFRLTPQDRALLRDPNSDDGDRHSKPGLISDRSDLSSYLAYDAGVFGANLAMAAWYDPVFLHANHNELPATFNAASVPPGSLPSAVQRIQGLDADLLDAFVHDRFKLAGAPITVRVGRFTLLWGESLFFGGNGVEALQAPQDQIRARDVPDSTAEELFLPVGQISASIKLLPGLSIEAYDQPEWRRDRLPGVSTVFSTNDTLDLGGERLFLPDGQVLSRGSDRVPGGSTDQFGLALHATQAQLDWGLYALEGDARSALVVVDPHAGRYQLVFPGHIGVVGVSASTFAGDSTLAAELSLHINVPVSAPSYLLEAQQIPRADSTNGQVSIVSQLAPSAFWQSATLSAELAGNAVVSASSSASSRSRAGRTTAAVEVQFQPHYYHVVRGIDLTPSLTVAYGLTGHSDIDSEMSAGAGAVTVGLTAAIRVLWHLSLRYTTFVGAPSEQPLADRDFATISLSRSF